MTKFKKALLMFFGAYLLAALPLAQAQNAPETDGSPQKLHSGQRIQEIYSQLNLTDDQKNQLEANKQQHRSKMEIIRQQMKINRQEFQEELMKPNLDMAKINAIHAQTKSLQSQMEDSRLGSILAVRAILTPEQFLKFVDRMQKHR